MSEALTWLPFQNHSDSRFSDAGRGRQAPNLEFIDIASRDRVPLTRLRGKIVLLELWATWCGPCQQAMRKLNELADARKDDWKGRVALVAVSIDYAPEVAAKHADRLGWTSLRHLWSQRSESDFQSDVEGAFSVRGVPTAILLDTDGKIVWYGHPVDANCRFTSGSNNCSSVSNQPGA